MKDNVSFLGVNFNNLRKAFYLLFFGVDKGACNDFNSPKYKYIIPMQGNFDNPVNDKSIDVKDTYLMYWIEADESLTHDDYVQHGAVATNRQKCVASVLVRTIGKESEKWVKAFRHLYKRAGVTEIWEGVCNATKLAYTSPIIPRKINLPGLNDQIGFDIRFKLYYDEEIKTNWEPLKGVDFTFSGILYLDDIEEGAILTENGSMLDSEKDITIVRETSLATNAVKISELPLSDKITNESFFPIVQDGDTKKIPFEYVKYDDTEIRYALEKLYGDVRGEINKLESAIGEKVGNEIDERLGDEIEKSLQTDFNKVLTVEGAIYGTRISELEETDELTPESIVPIVQGEVTKKINFDNIIPTGTILPIISNVIPPSWLLCDGSKFDVVKYPKLLEALGSDALPDLRGLFLQGANGNLAQTIEAGLPNITGTFSGFRTCNDNPLVTGAFNLRDDYRITAAEYAGKMYNGRIALDASSGETKTDGTLKTDEDYKVYGKSNTVQPPAYCVNYIIKAS